MWTVLHCVTYWELCIVFRWPSLANWVCFTLPQLAQIDLSCFDVPFNTKQTLNTNWSNNYYACSLDSKCLVVLTWLTSVRHMMLYLFIVLIEISPQWVGLVHLFYVLFHGLSVIMIGASLYVWLLRVFVFVMKLWLA